MMTLCGKPLEAASEVRVQLLQLIPTGAAHLETRDGGPRKMPNFSGNELRKAHLEDMEKQ